MASGHSADAENAKKAEERRVAVMDVVYSAIKAFKLRTVKATASVRVDHQSLVLEHSSDVLLGLVSIASRKRSAVSAGLQPLSQPGPAQRSSRQRSPAQLTTRAFVGVAAAAVPSLPLRVWTFFKIS